MEVAISNCERRFLSAILLTLTLSLFGAADVFAVDQIGVFWDTGFTETEIFPATLDVVTGYIVISDPSGTGGVVGWECAVEMTGPGTAMNWQLAGQALNLKMPPTFVVGLASPLPPAMDTMVASFDVMVTALAPVEVALVPVFNASLPDQMSYIDGLLPEQLLVLGTATGGPVVATLNPAGGFLCEPQHILGFGDVAVGDTATAYFTAENCGPGNLYLDVSIDLCTDPVFALTAVSGPLYLGPGELVSIPIIFTPTTVGTWQCRLNLGFSTGTPIMGAGVDPVAVEFPSPQVLQQNGLVNLEWAVRADPAEGYHVYRRDSGRRAARVRRTECDLAGAKRGRAACPERGLLCAAGNGESGGSPGDYAAEIAGTTSPVGTDVSPSPDRLVRGSSPTLSWYRKASEPLHYSRIAR